MSGGLGWKVGKGGQNKVEGRSRRGGGNSRKRKCQKNKVTFCEYNQRRSVDRKARPLSVPLVQG